VTKSTENPFAHLALSLLKFCDTDCNAIVVYTSMVQTLARGPWTAFVRPANTFGMPYFTQSYKYIVLVTQPLQVTHHWSAGKYVTVRG